MPRPSSGRPLKHGLRGALRHGRANAVECGVPAVSPHCDRLRERGSTGRGRPRSGASSTMAWTSTSLIFHGAGGRGGRVRGVGAHSPSHSPGSRGDYRRLAPAGTTCSSGTPAPASRRGCRGRHRRGAAGRSAGCGIGSPRTARSLAGQSAGRRRSTDVAKPWRQAERSSKGFEGRASRACCGGARSLATC